MPQDITPETQIEQFTLSYVEAIKYRLRSHQQIKRHLDRIALHFQGRAINTIKRKDIASYAEHRQNQGVKPGSINIELSIFSSAINYVNRRWETDLKNPVTGLNYPVSQSRLRYLEQQQAQSLIEQASRSPRHYIKPFIELALNTGCRKNELLTIKNTNIDLQRKIITIDATNSKNRKRRYIPINQTAEAAINQLQHYNKINCPQTPWLFSNRKGQRIKSPEHTFTKIVQQTNIQDFTIHDLRHTFASWLVSNGVELVKVRDLLGHSSIKQTEQYAHLSPDRLHDAVGVLDNIMPKP